MQTRQIEKHKCKGTCNGPFFVAKSGLNLEDYSSFSLNISQYLMIFQCGLDLKKLSNHGENEE